MKKLVILVAISAGTAASAETVVFSDDFSGGTAASEFSGAGSVEGVEGYSAVGGFSDSFLRNDTLSTPTVLSLSGLADHNLITISFDLAIIDSWDGANPLSIGGIPIAPDIFSLMLDGFTIAESAFNNFAGTVPPSGFTEIQGAAAALSPPIGKNLGFNSAYFDSAYRVSVTTAHTSSSAVFSFFATGAGWQGGTDESWAIDNVEVSLSGGPAVIPVPATLPLLVAGVLGLGVLGRRKVRNL